MYEKVQAKLQRMVQLGVIQPISEPTEWCSPMVVVPKKNGEVRVCVDYTKLNRSIQSERFQLPLADEIFAKLKGAQFFTTLDAAAGFWQIPLAEELKLLIDGIHHSVWPVSVYTLAFRIAIMTGSVS